MPNDGAVTDTQDRQDDYLFEHAYPDDDGDVVENRRDPAIKLERHDRHHQNRQHHSPGSQRRREGKGDQLVASRKLLW